MAFASPILRVPIDFGANDHSKITESIVKYFLVHFRIEITDKKISAHILRPFILWCLIDFNGFTEKFDHMHNFDWIISVLFTFKLDETKSLMLIRYFISWNVDIDNRPALRKELPKNVLVHFRV